MVAQNVSMLQLSDLLSRVVIKWRYVVFSQSDKCVCMTNFWLEKKCGLKLAGIGNIVVGMAYGLFSAGGHPNDAI